VDENASAVRTLTQVLEAGGYHVVETNGAELMASAISAQPDIIIVNSIISTGQQALQALRFEKGLENVVFLIYHQ
jgi:CheY-like chemotaxis protein